LPNNDQLKIRAYLGALAQEEWRLENRGDLRGLIELRLRELNWTLARVARRLRDRLLPSADPNKAPRPAWKKVAPPPVAPEKPLSRPRLLLDITSTLRTGRNTGIQRVAREIARHGWMMGEGLPVAIHNGRLFVYYEHADVAETIEIGAGDIFVMLDATWNHLDEYLPVLAEVKAKGGRAVVCLYDILPILYPDAFPSYLVARFHDWLQKVVLPSDAIVADSRAAAESLRDYLAETDEPARVPPISWWRLGADFPADAAQSPSPLARRLAQGGPYFLSVGTVEPRKGYPIVLDALEKLWGEGLDVTYVLVGARGWGMRAFEKRLRGHAELGRRLFWLDRAGDADLALLYRHARAMILASVAEGFGLPIVEASHYETPVIATDIAVFHETAGDSVLYFDLLDPDSLAARMKEALAVKPLPPVIPAMSWRDSARQLLALARR